MEKINITNRNENVVEIVVEPWADSFELREMESCCIEVHGKYDKNSILIEYDIGLFSVHLSSGCTAKVNFNNSHRDEIFFDNPAP